MYTNFYLHNPCHIHFIEKRNGNDSYNQHVNNLFKLYFLVNNMQAPAHFAGGGAN